MQACRSWRPTSCVDEADAQLDRAAVAEMLRSRLPDYMVPKYLDVVEHLRRRSTSGKVDRKQLPAPVNLLKGASRDVRGAAERYRARLAQAWEKCLQTSPVSVEDDFFLDLGGHSLLAAQVVTELQDAARHVAGSRCATSTSITHGPDAGRAAARSRHRAARDRPPPRPIDATPAEQAFATVPAWERWMCVGLQAISVMAIYGIVRRAVRLRCA